jgi:hypothetical protein
MEMFYCPDLLKNLAIEAAGELVTELFVQILRYDRHTDSRLMRPNYVAEACNHFHKMYVSIVPLPLAREMTIKLLRHLDQTYHKLRKINSGPIEGIASEILCAIIHPHVMELEFRECTSHPTPLDLHKTGASKFVFMTISKLKNLKTLKLGWSGSSPKWKLSNIGEELEKFSSLECDDKDIDNLSHYCKKLKSLDLTLAVNVTDESVDYLTRLHHLKELNVSGTKITPEGLTVLLTSFTSISVVGSGGSRRSLSRQLTSFGCDKPLTSHIDLLGKKFKNLTSLLFKTVDTEIRLTELRQLKHLTHFTIGSFGVSKEVLQVIGHQLKCLDIALHNLSELNWIYDCCPGVECLHLYFRKPNEPQSSLMAYFERYPLPQFQSVKCLQLIFFNQDITDYIVSLFVNIKKLYISHDGSDSLFKKIVQRKQLRHLEQFFWGDRTVVEFFGERAVITTINEESVSVHSTQT